jgi:hypothetical protein
MNTKLKEMNYHINFFRSVAVMATMALFACTSNNSKTQAQAVNTDTVNLNYTVEEAPEWNALFIRQSGWFGGDGIYVVPSDGARYKSPGAASNNMFIFSDTMIGDIVDGKLGKNVMVHNTVAYLKGDQPKKENIEFKWATDADGKPDHMFSPKTPGAKPGDYYWLGDAFYNTATQKTYIIAYRMHNMDTKDDWSFREVATDIIILPKGSKAPFSNQIQLETPLHYAGDGGGFGAGIFINTKEAGAINPDGYIYVYGSKIMGKDKKSLVVSRVKPEDFENFGAWRYWDGKEWNADKEKVAQLTTDISNELSVSPLPDGRYALVYQLGGMGETTAMRIGTTPVGPFGPVIKLYEAKAEDKKFFHYNAKAHPSLSAPGELLISYNQNTWDFHNKLKEYPNLYHPFFIKVKFK